MPERLMTVAELAKTLGLTPAGIYGMVHKRQLPFAVRISRRCLRFSPSGLAAWLANKQEDAPPAPALPAKKATRKRRGIVSASYVDSIVSAAKKEVIT